MARVNAFILFVLVGVMFLMLGLKLLLIPGTKPAGPEVRRVSDASPYIVMKTERETIIRRVLNNGEDLLIHEKLFKLYPPTLTCNYEVAHLGKCGGR